MSIYGGIAVHNVELLLRKKESAGRAVALSKYFKMRINSRRRAFIVGRSILFVAEKRIAVPSVLLYLIQSLVGLFDISIMPGIPGTVT